jgi:membrane-bound metal-dependent hydrolase YbcI (DUF457 family)
VFPFGHIGIGTSIVPPRIREQLRWRWIVLGCLLPDIIDKPLFIAARLLHRPGADHLYLLSGSRLFGHTLFLLAVLFIAAGRLRSAPLRAIGWGVATHIVLDLLPDFVSGYFFQFRHWLLWPLFGWGFPSEYGGRLVYGVDREYAAYIAGDLVGGALLVRQYLRSRRERRVLRPPTFR